MSRQNSGCGMLLIGVFVLAAVFWAVGVVLWLLALAVPVAGLLGAGYFLVRATQVRDEAVERAAADAELEILVQDAAFDLADTITRWDTLVFTKGIGTELQGHEEEAVAIQQQLFAAHEALLSAPTLPHRLRAVVRADELRESAERYL
ncbi:hypothetical protein [Corynebacterium humireducens]|nr:hypothetical protein [Corynebacterium humireducens]